MCVNTTRPLSGFILPTPAECLSGTFCDDQASVRTGAVQCEGALCLVCTTDSFSLFLLRLIPGQAITVSYNIQQGSPVPHISSCRPGGGGEKDGETVDGCDR